MTCLGHRCSRPVTPAGLKWYSQQGFAGGKLGSPSRKWTPMLDVLLAVLFVAMVLTPAVVAARSSQDPGLEE